MKHWINKNYRTLIISAFLIPIITVAIVSISHVTEWYGISNPLTWAIYLSIGIEIAALSAIAAISADMGRKVYFPFIIVTLIQFIGNIFFAYSYTDITTDRFKMWVELVSPLLEFIGIEPTDFVGHKRVLALFSGGMLPIISLSFLHMLVKYTEDDRKKEEIQEEIIVDGGSHTEDDKIDASDLMTELTRVRLTEEDLKKLENVLIKKYSSKNVEVSQDDETDEDIKDYEDLKLTEEKKTENKDVVLVPFDEAVDNTPEIEFNNDEFVSSNFDGFVPEPSATPEEVKEFEIDEKLGDNVEEEKVEDQSNEPNVEEQKAEEGKVEEEKKN
jgi:hypothetical protein